jgi:stringent starvation protein B
MPKLNPFKPYLIRAFYEWTVDNGHSPFIVAKPGAYARVPREYVKDEHIVLDISPEAVVDLFMDNVGISFKARFSGKSMDVYIPIENIAGIYPQELGPEEMMPFETSEPEHAPDEDNSKKSQKKPTLKLVK